MVGENGLETMTRAHFDFVAYVHEHCDHEACTLNGRIELRYCPKRSYQNEFWCRVMYCWQTRAQPIVRNASWMSARRS